MATPSPPPPAPPPAFPRRWRLAELGLLFGLLPWLISLGPRWVLLPVIMAGGLISASILLADPSFERAQLFNAAGLGQGWRWVLARTAVVGLGLLLVTLATRGPAALFSLPRQRPLIWLGVVVLYPVLSVYPQEIMYRAFFFHRYRSLFARPRSLLIANGLLFGWSHVIVHNRVAVLLATVGGLLFAWTFQRARSTALVAFEHALYGDLVFSVGVGGMFVNGVRLLSRVFQ